jgi:hypothetical protein
LVRRRNFAGIEGPRDLAGILRYPEALLVQLLLLLRVHGSLRPQSRVLLKVRVLGHLLVPSGVDRSWNRVDKSGFGRILRTRMNRKKL